MPTCRLAVLAALLGLALTLPLAAPWPPRPPTSPPRRPGARCGAMPPTPGGRSSCCSTGHRAAVGQRRARRAALHLPDQRRRLPRAPWPPATPGSSPRPRPAARIAATLASVARLERTSPAACSNWYDPATGAKLTTWPVDGNRYPFLSSVDNGWMAAALLMVATPSPAARPGPRPAPDGLRLLLRPGGRAAAGRVRSTAGRRAPSSATTADPPACGALHLPPLRQPEHRAAHRQLPRHRLRPGPGQPLLPDGPHLPADLRLGLAGAAAGRGHPHLPGRQVFEGHYRYRGMDIVPSWGGACSRP